MILDRIVQEKRQQLIVDKGLISIENMKYIIKNLPGFDKRDFKCIFKPKKIAIIGEVKKASPSAGVICDSFNPVMIAKEYKRHKIDAVSVLTEKRFFQGEDEHISAVKQNINMPVLRKDFIIDLWQIYQSKVLGADAILLITSILSDAQLVKFQVVAEILGMHCVVEVHDLRDLERALETEPQIIGINNRNLKTFSVDINNTCKLIKHIPKDIKVISESGINSKSEIDELQRAGVSGVLIGTAFMKSLDMSKKLRELTG